MTKFCTNCGSKLTHDPKFCPNCGSNINGEANNAAKRKKHNKVMNQKKRTFNSVNLILLVGLLGIIAIYISSGESKENKIIKKQPTVVAGFEYSSKRTNMVNVPSKVENGKIIIPLNDIKKEKFVSFTYNGKNGTVPLLAYISEEGKVITAISMCEPCNSTTFHIKSNELVCNSCGTTWEIDNLEAISGSCGKYPPDPIPSIVVGDEVQINEYSVTNWRRRI